MAVARIIRGAVGASDDDTTADATLLETVRLALRIDGTEADSLLVQNIAAAQALAERQAPLAPAAVKTEAIVRACGWLFDGAQTPGDQPAAIWRLSGAQALLSPWQTRRAGAIGE